MGHIFYTKCCILFTSNGRIQEIYIKLPCVIYGSDKKCQLKKLFSNVEIVYFLSKNGKLFTKIVMSYTSYRKEFIKQKQNSSQRQDFCFLERNKRSTNQHHFLHNKIRAKRHVPSHYTIGVLVKFENLLID